MVQHPIPQQITSYEFKLVGSMTLRQFLKAAGGIVIALLLKPTGLVFFIKWPLMAISAIGGIMLAFVPYQDRPLESWLLAFLKSIYSPTVYLYKKTGDKNWLDIDREKVAAEEKEAKKEELIPTKNQEQVNEFILSLPSTKKREGGDKDSATLGNNQIITGEQTMATTKPQIGAVEQGAGQKTKKADLGLKIQKLGATGQAVFGSIPMPDTPEIPNILAGMVTNKEGKIVEEAIIEIQDGGGNPVRILKTNALGQFKTASPLANGKYLVITEKDGYGFDRVNVGLEGKVVEPIKIIATG